MIATARAPAVAMSSLITLGRIQKQIVRKGLPVRAEATMAGLRGLAVFFLLAATVFVAHGHVPDYDYSKSVLCRVHVVRNLQLLCVLTSLLCSS